MVFMIIINIRKITESQVSVLFRILVNYAQVLGFVRTMALNIPHPDLVDAMFYPIRVIGKASEQIVSFECLFNMDALNVYLHNSNIVKIFFISILPIILIILFSIACLVMNKLNVKIFKEMKKSIVVSIVIVLYFLHPQLMGAGLDTFECIEIDHNRFVAKIDTNMECYSSEHTFWIVMLSLPLLLVWGIGIPLFEFFNLFKHRNELGNVKVKKYYHVLYQGLKHS